MSVRGITSPGGRRQNETTHKLIIIRISRFGIMSNKGPKPYFTGERSLGSTAVNIIIIKQKYYIKY